MSLPRVLVVDDEKDYLESLVWRLSRRGFTARGAASGAAALQRVEAESWEVVILDIRMADMDGLRVLRALKEKTPRTEVILLTGHASVESGVEGLKLGAFDYLIKPVKLDDLIERINDAYDRHRLRLRETDSASNDPR
jgi:DNA-binding NtrC family response regulator